MTTQTKRKTRREIAAGIILFRDSPEGPHFLLLYHGGEYWNFPKGKIESEEKSLEAALRETREETGFGRSDFRIIPGFKAHERFFFRRQGQPTFKIVIFYLAESRRRDVRLSREHKGYGWFSYRDAKRTVSRYKDTVKVLDRAYQFLRNRGR
jgi:8-oxo-dGTP pyrophosphatase MutT (NUDIX family)